MFIVASLLSCWYTRPVLACTTKLRVVVVSLSGRRIWLCGSSWWRASSVEEQEGRSWQVASWARLGLAATDNDERLTATDSTVWNRRTTAFDPQHSLISPRRHVQLERRDSPSFDSPRPVHPTPPTIPLHPVHAYTIPRPTHESLSQSPPYSSLLTALNTHPTEPTFHSSPCPSLVTPNPPNLSITSDYVPLLLLLWNQ